jgi:hypothetical protein
MPGWDSRNIVGGRAQRTSLEKISRKTVKIASGTIESLAGESSR